MNNLDHAFQRLVDANPEPSPFTLVASIRSRAAADPKGREPMTPEHVTAILDGPADPVEKRPGNWWRAAAAAAVVAVFGAVPFLADGGQDVASLTDAEIATAFLSGEVERPSELFAPDAVIEHRFLPTGDVDGWYVWRDAIGEVNTDVQCTGEGEVACTFTFQLDAAAAQGLGPYPFNSASFSFEDGLITRWADLTNPNDAARDVWNPFFDWLDPALSDRMYRVADSGQIRPLFTDESLGLWAAQIDAYISQFSG